MKFYVPDHSVACQASALISAVENLRDRENILPADFHTLVSIGVLTMEADRLLEDDSMMREICKCHVLPMKHVIEALQSGQPFRAEGLAQAYLDNGQISREDYVTLVKFTESQHA